MPWLPLFNDIKQGIFYAALMIFWLVFTGEHLINDDGTGEKNGLVAYWKKLAVVMFGCLCLFIFDVCERGVQLKVTLRFCDKMFGGKICKIGSVKCLENRIVGHL